MKAQTKQFGTLSFHPSLIQKNKKALKLVIKIKKQGMSLLHSLEIKIKILRKLIDYFQLFVLKNIYIEHLSNRFDVREKSLDDNEATLDIMEI